ncbi:translesion DNA synthesis-associated protein ImuA [Pseudoalteromonas sp. MMG022]|uniref:translesion DNA synthesis-associated protein ImuA n=1 Tax=Pseudoalteromonas sp. MMG022 TaxID=2909978 RepID=UPI001F02DD4C|nr:translesion DNA synthesis-associated protein ImuA [Pseudoalteromonas sp. MMG022]MCF6434120.1 translesion DNA synthesis-associated protein ImuA [Pseudoalteromonas sp. MMG022]
MSKIIDLLQHRQWVWQGSSQAHQPPERVSTCIPLLDIKLQGGLPKRGMVEVQADNGIGELQIWLPYLQQHQHLIVFINPPGCVNAHQFYHLGFEHKQLLVINTGTEIDALWAAEQCLKSSACSVVLLWQSALSIAQAKRLQLASEQGGCTLFLYRPRCEQKFSLPVVLCLQLTGHPHGIAVQIKKQRGGWPQKSFMLSLADYWPQLIAEQGEASNVTLFPTPIRYAK